MKTFNSNFKKTICYNIRKFRRESGKSVMEVSEELGITPEYLKRIESINDPRKNCSLTLLYKLSIIFDKNINDFFIEENEEKKKVTQ